VSCFFAGKVLVLNEKEGIRKEGIRKEGIRKEGIRKEGDILKLRSSKIIF
jgi:hypothetical protein